MDNIIQLDVVYMWCICFIYRVELRGGSRIYKRGGGLTQATNLLGRGVQSMLELGGSGGMPPPGNF